MLVPVCLPSEGAWCNQPAKLLKEPASCRRTKCMRKLFWYMSAIHFVYFAGWEAKWCLFFFFQDSKMNHTFCLRSSIYVSLEMWSLFSLLQTWARCFSVVHIYEYGFLSLFPFLSPPPFFFSSSLTFLSFSCSVWIYGSSQTKGIYSFCRRKVVRGKALRSSVLSGDYLMSQDVP